MINKVAKAPGGLLGNTLVIFLDFLVMHAGIGYVIHYQPDRTPVRHLFCTLKINVLIFSHACITRKRSWKTKVQLYFSSKMQMSKWNIQQNILIWLPKINPFSEEKLMSELCIEHRKFLTLNFVEIIKAFCIYIRKGKLTSFTYIPMCIYFVPALYPIGIHNMFLPVSLQVFKS